MTELYRRIPMKYKYHYYENMKPKTISIQTLRKTLIRNASLPAKVIRIFYCAHNSIYLAFYNTGTYFYSQNAS